MTIIQKMQTWLGKIDLPYRMVGLIVIGLGASILFSRPIQASTTYWIERNFGISQVMFAIFALLCGAFLLFRHVNKRLFAVLILPLSFYTVANITYVLSQHLSSTVPTMLLGLVTFIYSVGVMGFRRL